MNRCMTSNAIAFNKMQNENRLREAELKEAKRANKEKEAETRRSNRANEALKEYSTDMQALTKSGKVGQLEALGKYYTKGIKTTVGNIPAAFDSKPAQDSGYNNRLNNNLWGGK